MAARSLPIELDRGLRSGFYRVADPGAGNEIAGHNKGFMLVPVVTAAAETRSLKAATAYSLGTRIIVFFKEDGGDLTITGADSNVVLEDAGDFAEFVVTDNDGTLVWRVASSTKPITSTATTQIPITDFRSGVAVEALVPTTATDALLAVVSGTHGTSQPHLKADVADKKDTAAAKARIQVRIPADYKAGEDVTFIIEADEETAADTSATIDADARIVGATPGSDLVTTAAQDITGASDADQSFTVTGTNLSPGDLLDIVITATIDDSKAGKGFEYRFANFRLQYTAV